MARDNSNRSTNAQAAQVAAEEEVVIVAPEVVIRGHDVPGVALEGEDSPEWVLHHQQYTIGYPGFTGPLSADEYNTRLASLQRKARRAESAARKAAISAAAASAPAKAPRRSRAKSKANTETPAAQAAPAAAAAPAPEVGQPAPAVEQDQADAAS